MANLGRFWNGKVGGLPAFAYMVLVRIFEVCSNRITTFFVTKNLKIVGKDVLISSGFKYRYPNNIIIGNNVIIGPNVKFSSELRAGRMIIEDNVIIGRNCEIDFSGDVVLEEGVVLSEGVVIQTHDHGFDPKGEPIGKSLRVGGNAWLGIYATVLSNTRLIGKNSILAAHSVATKEIEENSIYAGIPASRLKTRS